MLYVKYYINIILDMHFLLSDFIVSIFVFKYLIDSLIYCAPFLYTI